MVKCNSCGGVYNQVLADGALYFHACPWLSDAEVIAALKLPADPTTWTAGQKTAFAQFPRTRPNARDENLPSTAEADHGRIKALGLGVTVLAP